MNAIPLKFKYADPEVVTKLITDALNDSHWMQTASGPPPVAVPQIVHDINLALFHAGCVVIQLDRPVT